MSLLSAQQKATFDYYLLSDYQRHRSDLVAVAKAVYQQVKAVLKSAGPGGILVGNPDRADCLLVLITALLSSQRFTHILNAKQHLKGSMRLLLADITARYLLEADWIEIAF